MRSYALLVLAVAVLHARAATIPAPAETEKKLPVNKDALDDVSLDNNDSEQELIDASHTVKDIENNLRNSSPVENVPVKVIEEKVVIKTVPVKEDSNDYVPDHDDSTNIKRIEIDLNNPGPPQRQEHDSQNPSYYLHNERAVAAIKQSIAESQLIFKRGIEDVTQRFKNYFENNNELEEVSKNIQNLRKNFDAEVAKLSDSINAFFKPEGVEVVGDESEDKPQDIKEVKNRLKTLENTFNSGVGILSEGVELLSILKEEDEQNLKISGKADTENVGGAGNTGTTNPATGSGSGTGTQVPPAPVFGWIQTIQNSVTEAFSNLGNAFNQNTNNQTPTQNPSNATQGFNPSNIFQNFNIPNIFQQNQNPTQQGTAPAGAQADDASATDRPNFIQQALQNWQQTNPISQFFTGVTNFFQPPAQPTGEQAGTSNTAASQSAAGSPAASPAADTPQGTNSVPAAAPPQAEPAKPAKESEPAKPVQAGPIQQIVQNSPIVKGITNAVQRIQGLSNPSKPRDSVEENVGTKGHGPGGAATGNTGLGAQSETMKEQPEQPVKEQPEKKEPINEAPEKLEAVKEVAEKKEPEKELAENKEPEKDLVDKKEPVKEFAEKKEPVKDVVEEKEPVKEVPEEKEAVKELPEKERPETVIVMENCEHVVTADRNKTE